MKWRGAVDAFGQMVSTASAINSPLRFAGQYQDNETGYYQNYFRDYNVASGRYLQTEPVGLSGGINRFGYADQNPLVMYDPFGLSPEPGGPWHPPKGVKTKCTKTDSSTQLRNKIWILTKMVYSHQKWDWTMAKPRGGDRHKKEIGDLWNGLAKCIDLAAKKAKKACKEVPKKRILPVIPLTPFLIWDLLEEQCKAGVRGACLPFREPEHEPYFI